MRSYRGKQNLIQAQCTSRRPRHSQVAHVRWIKTPPEKRNPPVRSFRVAHATILICPQPAHSGSIRLIPMRYFILILALLGVAVSSLALRVHYSTGTEPCSINETWDCGVVNHSPFAEIEHVPVAAIGIAGYLLLALLALLRRRVILSVLAVCALAFSLYLTGIEKDVLQVYCLYCVISLGVISIITLLSLWWALSVPPIPKRRRS